MPARNAVQPSSIPPGWSYNPAAWSQRLPIIGLALVGFGIALYLALFQWDTFDEVWEPFFGDDSRTILLDSWVSQLLPVPDELLGALGYLADAVAGVIGGRSRWRTQPWVVVLFGLLVGPFGVVSIMLVVFQPVLFDAYCTLCLASAVVSVLMIGPAMDEMLASCQHLRRVRDAGRPFWPAFWGRETSPMRWPARERDHAVAPRDVAQRRLSTAVQAVAGLAGVWLLASPEVLGYTGVAAQVTQSIGPVAATFAIIAAWEVTRPARWPNVLLGPAIAVAPFLVGGFGLAGTVNAVVVGVGIGVAALVGGMDREKFGGGWRTAVRSGSGEPSPRTLEPGD